MEIIRINIHPLFSFFLLFFWDLVQKKLTYLEETKFPVNHSVILWHLKWSNILGWIFLLEFKTKSLNDCSLYNFLVENTTLDKSATFFCYFRNDQRMKFLQELKGKGWQILSFAILFISSLFYMEPYLSNNFQRS